MESFDIKNLSFCYPATDNKVLDNICLKIDQGEFVTVCGKSGCGKTTLLRMLKSSLTPFGNISGDVFFEGKPISEFDVKQQASKIGFVMQSCDNQIVTDKVCHELAFGLESLGYSSNEIRTRVSEMASFFGIENWFHKSVSELSGGQKQLLSVASVLAMQPSVLVLDEPTAQLDPIAAHEFIKNLERINRELAVTVIIAEHRLEETVPVSDRVVVMDEGRIIADGDPKSVGSMLKGHEMFEAFPTPMRVYSYIENNLECPVTVREGRVWLEEFSKEHKINSEIIPKDKTVYSDCTVVELKDLWCRYEKNSLDVIKGLNIKVNKGELFSIVGANGTGKSTVLSLVAGLNKPYRGKVIINGKSTTGRLAMLPQNPQTVFSKNTVYLDLQDVLDDKKFEKEQKSKMISDISGLCRIESLLDSHPYDLSGGEQQRAALAKVLLTNPEILLLDEPTKGMDASFKHEFADILYELKQNGVTVIMVSHDIEFCAAYSDRCALMFDGNFTSCSTPRTFFAGNSFYTTSANRMARQMLPDAVIADDIILACGGILQKKEIKKTDFKKNCDYKICENKTKKLSIPRIIFGCVFSVLSILTIVSSMTDADILSFKKTHFADSSLIQLISLLQLFVALICFFPNTNKVKRTNVKPSKEERKLSKRTLVSIVLIVAAIPFTIYSGIRFFGDRKYYFISLLIILETLIPFFMVFENKKPKAREMVLISSLCAIAVVSRSVFVALPQFKPVIAIVIISGVCFGGETGFLVGSVTAFVSNFFFGQGPWTPWQMFAFGIIGFLSGILFKKGVLKSSRTCMCVFGFAAVIVIFGGIMNMSTVLQTQTEINREMVIAAYASGLPFDLVHGVSTFLFLWFISEPMIEKLERIKVKYGIIAT